MPADTNEENSAMLQVANKAKAEGFIKLIDLEYFLASDTSYSADILDKINVTFHVMWNDPGGSWSKESRHGFWLWVLLRWAGVRGDATKAKLPDIGRYLPVYVYDTASGDYNKLSVKETSAGLFDKVYISLSEFAQYLGKIARSYQINLQLPEALDAIELSENGQETKLSADKPFTEKLRKRFKTKKAFEQVVEMADRLLNIRRVNPRITRSELKKDYKTYFPGKQAWSTFERNMQALQGSGDSSYKDLLPKDRPGSKKRRNP